MRRETECSKIGEAIEQFDFGGQHVTATEFGNGHINDTFLLRISQEGAEEKRVILQRMNHEIFRHPEELMENILQVTSYLREKIISAGGDPDRETLNVYLTNDKNSKNGKQAYYKDSQGSYWRAYHFIERATSYNAVKRPEDFYESAVAFGHFQKMLADFPAASLHETIEGFHDTSARYERFLKVVEEDRLGRAKNAEAEIRFVKNRKEIAEVLGRLQAEGKLPLRVTHNDTKLNNIMMDDETGKGLCVIDLDTVMPGLAVNDFGDSIRFGASTGAEDEQDLSKISCDMSLFALYTKGFLEGCGGSLTKEEIKALPLGALVMTFECGMRFLTDYLEGDVYFKIHREGHNLDRCRTQFKLVQDMEEKWDEMQKIVAQAAAELS